MWDRDVEETATDQKERTVGDAGVWREGEKGKAGNMGGGWRGVGSQSRVINSA